MGFQGPERTELARRKRAAGLRQTFFRELQSVAQIPTLVRKFSLGELKARHAEKSTVRILSQARLAAGRRRNRRTIRARRLDWFRSRFRSRLRGSCRRRSCYHCTGNPEKGEDTEEYSKHESVLLVGPALQLSAHLMSSQISSDKQLYM